MTAPHRPAPRPPGPGPTAQRPAGTEPLPGPTATERPAVTRLHLTAFAGHRGTTVPLAPLTLLAGPSGSGKSTVLAAHEALARLAAGATLPEAFGDPSACVPDAFGAPRGDGFRVGCTTTGPAGSVRLDLVVRPWPEPHIAHERLTAGPLTLLETNAVETVSWDSRSPGSPRRLRGAPDLRSDPAARSHRRRAVRAAWHTGPGAPPAGAVLPGDRLGTALLPLRVSGSSAGERHVVAAAEQLLVALRSVFACDPCPPRMRRPERPLPGSVPDEGGVGGRLLRGCDNLAEVVARTHTECTRRHARFVEAVRAGCTGVVRQVYGERLADGSMRTVLERGDGTRVRAERLGDGELRYLALALVLLTGPGVLQVDPVTEVPGACQTLTVLADGFDRCLDARQTRELLRLAAQMCAGGHLRLLAAVSGTSPPPGGRLPGTSVVHLGRDRHATTPRT